MSFFSFFDDAVTAVGDWWSGTPSSDANFGYDMSSGDTSWTAAADSTASWTDSLPAANWDSVVGAAGSVAKDVGGSLLKSVPTAVGASLGGGGQAASTNVNVTTSPSMGGVGGPPDPTPKRSRRRNSQSSYALQQMQQNPMFAQTQAIRGFN